MRPADNRVSSRPRITSEAALASVTDGDEASSQGGGRRELRTHFHPYRSALSAAGARPSSREYWCAERGTAAILRPTASSIGPAPSGCRVLKVVPAIFRNCGNCGIGARRMSKAATKFAAEQERDIGLV
jgi:hypothetical protein